MMVWGWIFLAAVATLVILMILFRKNPIVQKYWKYTLILAPAVILVILILINSKGKKPTDHADDIAKTINQIKDNLVETHMIAAIQVSAAKQQEADKITQLEQIKKIDDQAERLKQLAAMMG